jgi:hypothetical protein
VDACVSIGRALAITIRQVRFDNDSKLTMTAFGNANWTGRLSLNISESLISDSQLKFSGVWFSAHLFVDRLSVSKQVLSSLPSMVSFSTFAMNQSTLAVTNSRFRLLTNVSNPFIPLLVGGPGPLAATFVASTVHFVNMIFDALVLSSGPHGRVMTISADLSGSSAFSIYANSILLTAEGTAQAILFNRLSLKERSRLAVTSNGVFTSGRLSSAVNAVSISLDSYSELSFETNTFTSEDFGSLPNSAVILGSTSFRIENFSSCILTGNMIWARSTAAEVSGTLFSTLIVANHATLQIRRGAITSTSTQASARCISQKSGPFLVSNNSVVLIDGVTMSASTDVVRASYAVIFQPVSFNITRFASVLFHGCNMTIRTVNISACTSIYINALISCPTPCATTSVVIANNSMLSINSCNFIAVNTTSALDGALVFVSNISISDFSAFIISANRQSFMSGGLALPVPQQLITTLQSAVPQPDATSVFGFRGNLDSSGGVRPVASGWRVSSVSLETGCTTTFDCYSPYAINVSGVSPPDCICQCRAGPLERRLRTCSPKTLWYDTATAEMSPSLTLSRPTSERSSSLSRSFTRSASRSCSMSIHPTWSITVSSSASGTGELTETNSSSDSSSLLQHSSSLTFSATESFSHSLTATKSRPSASLTVSDSRSVAIPECNATQRTLLASRVSPPGISVSDFRSIFRTTAADSKVAIVVNLTATYATEVLPESDLFPMAVSCSWGSAVARWVSPFEVAVDLSANSSEVNFFMLYADGAIRCSITRISVHGADGCISRNASIADPFAFSIIGLSKPLPAEATTAVLAVAAVTASSGSVVSTPGMALSQGRIAVVSDLAFCSYSTDGSPLDVLTSPTGWVIGVGAGRYFRGAIVGNMCLLCGFACVVMSTALVMVAGGFRKGLRQGMLTLHAPGIFVVPFSVLLQGTVMSSVGLISVGGEAPDWVIGGLVLLGHVAAAGCVLFFLANNVRFRAVYKALESPLEPSSNRHLGWPAKMLHRTGRWVDKDDSLGFKRGYHHLFSDYCGGRQWYGVVDLGGSILMATAAGIQVESFCAAAQISVLVVSFLQLLVAVVANPWDVLLLKIHQLTILGFTTLAALLSVIGNSLDSTNVQAASVFVSVTLQILTSLTAIVPLVKAGKSLYRLGLAAIFALPSQETSSAAVCTDSQRPLLSHRSVEDPTNEFELDALPPPRTEESIPQSLSLDQRTRDKPAQNIECDAPLLTKLLPVEINGPMEILAKRSSSDSSDSSAIRDHTDESSRFFAGDMPPEFRSTALPAQDNLDDCDLLGSSAEAPPANSVDKKLKEKDFFFMSSDRAELPMSARQTSLNDENEDREARQQKLSRLLASMGVRDAEDIL